MTINGYLENIAKKLIVRDEHRNSIKNSIGAIKDRLNSYFQGEIEEQFIFGSYKRDTILPHNVDINSDVDYMVVFKKNSNYYSPQTYLNKLKNFAECWYSSSIKKQSYPTIKLQLNHIIFELVPAISNDNNFFSKGYYIPKKSGENDWLITNPNDFNDSLTNANKNNKNLIKPLIRLLKCWNVMNNYVYESFELEKKIINTDFYWCNSLEDYFYKVIEGFSNDYYSLSQDKNERITKAKTIVQEIKQLKGYNNIFCENQIKKLIPEI